MKGTCLSHKIEKKKKTHTRNYEDRNSKEQYEEWGENFYSMGFFFPALNDGTPKTYYNFSPMKIT